MRRQVKIPDPQDEIVTRIKSCAPDSQDVMWQVNTTDKEILSQVDHVLTTGIKAFDDIVGGMPFGRIVELFGLEGCGKTAMALRCAGRARNKCIRQIIRNDDDSVSFKDIDPDLVDVAVFYIDNEGSLDLDGKITFDGQVLKIVNFRCDTTENMFKAIDKTIDFARDRQEKYPERKLFTLIVVDTIAATSTNKELATPWGAPDYPRQPLEISRGLCKLVRKVNRYNICLICTNQVRSTFKQAANKRLVFGINPQDYKSSGGYALRFYATHRVFMWALDGKYKLVPHAKFPAGLRIGFHTVKNRIKKPLRDGRMVILFDRVKGGFNDPWSMLETLLFLGFVECKKEKGTDFVVKFNKHGIVPTTFGAEETTTTLEEDDNNPLPRRGSSRKDPTFRFCSEWPQFVAEHQADIDKLWEAAMLFVDQTEGLEGSVSVEEQADDDYERVDDNE